MTLLTTVLNYPMFQTKFSKLGTLSITIHSFVQLQLPMIHDYNNDLRLT